MIKEDKLKALESAMLSIQKDFGKGSIMKLGENVKMEVETFPTGSLKLDIALGVGGLPKGRVIEVYGNESSGKTTLALHTIAEVQKLDGICAFIDAEHALDPKYAKNLGVNIDELLISQPDSGEEALEIAEKLVRSGAIDFIVVDSVAALTPKAEIDGEMGDQQMGLQARLMSKALRKLTPVISKSNCSILFINQLREKIGVMFGNPQTTTGGKALKFYSTVRLEITKIGAGKSGGEIISNETRVKVVKNKIAPPFKEVKFFILFGKGINKTGEIVELAVDAKLLTKSGAWYAKDGKNIGQGLDNTCTYLNEHTDLRDELEKGIIEFFKQHDIDEVEDIAKVDKTSSIEE